MSKLKQWFWRWICGRWRWLPHKWGESKLGYTHGEGWNKVFMHCTRCGKQASMHEFHLYINSFFSAEDLAILRKMVFEGTVATKDGEIVDLFKGVEDE